MSTKHEQILRHIEDLAVGEKISVRQIARALTVSEGTAYRAIKEAENNKLVNTIERVGTVRIEKKKKENIERLTFAEVVNIVDGSVLGGSGGLHKTLTKFLIGAMQLDDIRRYIDAGSLLIVGNRQKAHQLAISEGAAVLVTGGFDTTDEVKKLANSLDLPVITTSYDSFTVATMLNRAISDQMIEKDILLVEDIQHSLSNTSTLFIQETVEQFNELSRKTSHSAFPVIERNGKVIGMVTSKDVVGKQESEPLGKVMTASPITATGKMSVASAGHIMVWEGIDLLPVVTEMGLLDGVISRQDVLKAFQLAQRQPQQGQTIDDIVKNQMHSDTENPQNIMFEVIPQMTNQLGSLSYGALTTLLAETGNRAIKLYKRGESVPENLSIYFMRHVQLGSKVIVEPQILHMSRRVVKMDISLYSEGEMIGKALVTYQLLER
ncbi:CBS domain-containing protein [Sporosarcina sp. BI001-red]|uniref:DRTGG domain-containing protein n=1 Tax=Sporosarcina sp. BI001-red TaxID=2282866 RepID=UPI000E247F65|nr:DRTGG domain-containing protein [Sporosarcina sp. BI001-red]REB06550.1 CBS domain-containing protein [Sporosarcina sp. BI001-red]